MNVRLGAKEENLDNTYKKMGTYWSKESLNVRPNFQEFIHVENIDPDQQLIIQLCRKNVLHKELHNYYENSGQMSVYHKHMLGTLEYVGSGQTENIYISELCSNILMSLYPWPSGSTSKIDDDKFLSILVDYY